MYGDYEIQTLPLSLGSTRKRVERFLAENGLRLDTVDYYAVVTRVDDDQILAGGGLDGNVIKCVAVSDELRGTGMMQSLLSHLLSTARERGHQQVRVFTKPSNQDIFASLGFKLLAAAPQAIMMENAVGGLTDYCNYLMGLRRPGKNGMIVMNANPFTEGHLALVEYASSQVNTLYVIVVKEDCSRFSYTSRLAMVKNGCSHVRNAVVCEGSDYAISAATFPTYFLKQLSDASDTQILLDLDLCVRHLAPALGATVRFVGNEPTDLVTARYVELMQQHLPQHGIDVVVMPRVTQEGQVVSASLVRGNLHDGDLSHAIPLVPHSTLPYLLSELARQALEEELMTTPKPGLVDEHDNGSHSDMDIPLMRHSIEALRPSFDQLALLGDSRLLPPSEYIQHLGVVSEQKMLQATHGVNTHRGALFSIGLALVAASHTWHNEHAFKAKALRQDIMKLAHGIVPANNGSHGYRAVEAHHVEGALEMARHGYQRLFNEWLPFHASLNGDPYRDHKTLLLIMSELDDTNVIHRVGYEMAQAVKREALEMLKHFSIEGLEAMNRSFVSRNISPGGAADMLSLTIFIDSITK
ncbi:MAG: [Muribaculaceae bacterium]|nr:[citrate (pro-3S)-lyase] ligase [Muribaculaceae bacterium]